MHSAYSKVFQFSLPYNEEFLNRKKKTKSKFVFSLSPFRERETFGLAGGGTQSDSRGRYVREGRRRG